MRVWSDEQQPDSQRDAPRLLLPGLLATALALGAINGFANIKFILDSKDVESRAQEAGFNPEVVWDIRGALLGEWIFSDQVYRVVSDSLPDEHTLKPGCEIRLGIGQTNEGEKHGITRVVSPNDEMKWGALSPDYALLAAARLGCLEPTDNLDQPTPEQLYILGVIKDAGIPTDLLVLEGGRVSMGVGDYTIYFGVQSINESRIPGPDVNRLYAVIYGPDGELVSEDSGPFGSRMDPEFTPPAKPRPIGWEDIMKLIQYPLTSS